MERSSYEYAWGVKMLVPYSNIRMKQLSQDSPRLKTMCASTTLLETRLQIHNDLENRIRLHPAKRMHSGGQWLITAWAMTLFTQHRTEPGTCADTAKRIWKLEENSEPISDMHNVKGYCKQKNKSDLSSSIMFSIIHISYCYICMLLFPWNDQRPNGFIVIVLKQSMEVVCTLFWISWWRSEKKGSPAVALLLLSSGANLNIFFKNHPPPFIIVRGKNYI